MADCICPHCERPNPAPGPNDSRILDCLHCERSFAATDPAGAAGASAGAGRQTLPPPEPNPAADAPLLASAAAAAGLTALFYVALVNPLRETPFGELLGQRGWVPYVIAWLSAWAFVLLGLKGWRLSRQTRTLDLDLLPETIDLRITPQNAHVFSSYLRHLSDASRGGFVFGRLQAALQHFRAHPRAREVMERLALQAQTDADAVDGSYTLLRVFIWAIPILGFIGTVIGIGAAVGAFSDTVGNAVDLEIMKQSIGAVTSGLGVAFDTTLLALVMSLLIMFPASTLQKAEEDFLSRVDSYCERELLRRLDDGGLDSKTGGSSATGAERESAGAADEGLGREVSRLADAVTRLEQRLGMGPA